MISITVPRNRILCMICKELSSGSNKVGSEKNCSWRGRGQQNLTYHEGEMGCFKSARGSQPDGKSVEVAEGIIKPSTHDTTPRMTVHVFGENGSRVRLQVFLGHGRNAVLVDSALGQGEAQ